LVTLLKYLFGITSHLYEKGLSASRLLFAASRLYYIAILYTLHVRMLEVEIYGLLSQHLIKLINLMADKGSNDNHQWQQIYPL